MIALDTNILVYAHREDSPWHTAAARVMRNLDDRNQRWAIPWPCVYEFYCVVTHPSIFEVPTPTDLALEAVAGWLSSEQLSLLSEEENHFSQLSTKLKSLNIRGARIHDARIAILCAAHGVQELWSMDRDFSRFPFLKVRNPLI